MSIRQDLWERTTAHRIAEAATDLFLEKGYRATTMIEIATSAEVAVQTIYNVVGSKSAVLNLVLETTVSGTEAPRPVPEFMRERSAGLPNANAAIEALGDWFMEVHERSGEMFRMIREAAAVDPEVAAFEKEREKRRLSNYELAARMIVSKPGAIPRLDVEEAAAVLWSVGHPHVYRRLVIESTWTPTQYKTWVVKTLQGALLTKS